MAHGLGRLPSPPDARDHALAAYVPRLAAVVERIPDRFFSTVFPHVLPVPDQGDTPRCVGYGTGVQRAIAEWRDERRILTFDADELYARCKERDGIPGADGTYPRVAMELLRDRGMVVSASPEPGEVGALRPIKAYARLRTLDEVKAAIFLFGSAGVGSPWFTSWFAPGAYGMLPEPDAEEGGHWYTLVGYNERAFRVVNSWGRGWGHNGRAWLPFEYVGDLAEQGDGAAWEAWRTIDVLGDR